MLWGGPEVGLCRLAWVAMCRVATHDREPCSMRLLSLVLLRLLHLLLSFGRASASRDVKLVAQRHKVSMLRRTNPRPCLVWGLLPLARKVGVVDGGLPHLHTRFLATWLTSRRPRVFSSRVVSVIASATSPPRHPLARHRISFTPLAVTPSRVGTF